MVHIMHYINLISVAIEYLSSTVSVLFTFCSLLLLFSVQVCPFVCLLICIFEWWQLS